MNYPKTFWAPNVNSLKEVAFPARLVLFVIFGCNELLLLPRWHPEDPPPRLPHSPFRRASLVRVSVDFRASLSLLFSAYDRYSQLDPAPARCRRWVSHTCRFRSWNGISLSFTPFPLLG